MKSLTAKIKWVSVFVLLLTAGGLFGDYPAYDLNNPVSSTQIAMGGEHACGAYIWSRNPMNAWQNPAVLGYQNGFSLGYFMNDGADFCDESASAVAFGWNGIGILLPSINASGKFGHTWDYGDFTLWSEEEGRVGKSEVYDTCQQYAIGVNLIELLDAENVFAMPHRRMFDLSLGLSALQYNMDVNHHYNSGYTGEKSQATGVCKNMLNAGVIARFSPFAGGDKPVFLDFTLGGKWENIGKENDVCYGALYSNAIRFGLNNKFLKNSALKNFVESLVSLTLTNDYYLFEVPNDEDLFINAYEFGLFDTFFIRRGSYYEVLHTDEKKSANGFGLKFHYRDWVYCEWNWAESDFGWVYEYDCWDMMVNVNLWKIVFGG